MIRSAQKIHLELRASLTLNDSIRWTLTWLALVVGCAVGAADRDPNGSTANSRPNLIYILCDDLGYGDVKCFNPNAKIPTPHIDRLAQEGMRLTDAHSSASVCTPTRYGIMTGRYNWRSRLKRGVLGGLSPLLIEPGRLTVPAFLKQHGYSTACIGKWHLGMDWARHEGKSISELAIESADQVWNVDFTQPVRRGPHSVGFDYFFGISASLDMVPYTFIENDRVASIPTIEKDFAMMHGRAGGRTRRGPAAPDFEAGEVLPRLTQRAVDYIEQQAPSARNGRPFFLYLALPSPHTPILPAPEWLGKSGLNSYADFVMQTDASLGRVMRALEKNGLNDNSLVIFTSDNGCSPQAQFDELAASGHHPSARFRGAKADIYEGGHRVPFIARWPGQVPAGSVSDHLISLNDLLATCADLLGVRLPSGSGEDSVSILPVLKRTATEPVRSSLVHHSINGTFAVRNGPWKLVRGPDSGGWSAPRPGTVNDGTKVQLFNLAADIGEKSNVATDHPEIVERLSTLLDTIILKHD